jgi:hypothetical protein
MRARALIVVVLLVSYGAVGARQPAVRMAVPLPVRAERIAEALGIVSIDRSQFVLDIIRTFFAVGLPEGDGRQRAAFKQLLLEPRVAKGEDVPLPLDASIWRETLLGRQVPDQDLIEAILSDRTASLIYHGLFGLDDDTLAWLGPERDTLRVLARHAGAFSVFGTSLRVQAGKVIVPGGTDAEPLWQAIVGADPAKPAAFIRKLFDDEAGFRVWFYDSLAQLDPARLRFALGLSLPPAARIERLRALVEVFEHSGTDWRPEPQPFTRRPLDPALTLAVVSVNSDGTLAGPPQRAFWDRVFADGDVTVGGATKDQTKEKDQSAAGDTNPIDAAWLVGRVHRAAFDIGRRRLETFLFGQRLFADQRTFDPAVLTALRAYYAFPALLLTLERAGITDAATMSAVIARAETLNSIGDDQRRQYATLQFQAMLALIERMTRAGSLPRADANAAVTSLAQIKTTNRGYEGELGAWIRKDLMAQLPPTLRETPDAIEDAIVGNVAGAKIEAEPTRVVEWEGRSYRVSAGGAEAWRLRRVRGRQGGLSLSQALELQEKQKGDASERALANTLTSIVYAACLGDPDGPALSAGNVALQHDLGASGASGIRAAWQVPSESHTGKGWKITGSLLGLDVPLARMWLRRMDATMMPPEPRMVSAERQVTALTVALLNPSALTDAARDEIAAALARGRARVEALTGDRADIERVARDAGLSAWRREALAWTIAHDRARVPSQLSLVDFLWIGKPRTSEAIALDPWGAAMLPLNGCLCLAMPRAQPWESLIGRPALGLLATRGADVGLLVADTLASLKMPAEIAPGVIAFAMQEVMDQARPAHFDDWFEFNRATIAVTRDRLVDYIAAQTAGGALLPAKAGDRH